MQITDYKISELKPYDKNARIHSSKQINLLVKNIEKFGFTTPVLISKDNNVIAGHGRLMAVKKMGWTEVPCVLMENLNEEEIKALRLADNQIATMAGWDMKLAIEELRGLSDEMFDLTGFDKDLIINVGEDEVPGMPKDVQSKLGDLYELGGHRLLCGNAEKDEDYQKLFGGGQANLIFTDPPYSVNYKSVAGYTYNSKKFGGTGGKIFNDDKNAEEAEKFYRNVLNKIYKYSVDNASIYWWYATKQVIANRNALFFASSDLA